MQTPVSLRFCNTYEPQAVHAALEKNIADLGGLGNFINPGEKVLLKVNLLTKKKPEDATTTHPAVVQALAEMLFAHGASKVIIGDSPGGPFSASMLSGIYKATGMEAVASATGAVLNANYASFEKENPHGLIMKRLTLTDMLNDADKVICVAKLKTHGMMAYTGAAKNMFGTVPGTAKAEYHMNIPDYDNFADALIDICLCANPVLSVIDGIVGMEGDGPSAGTPVSTNVLVASPSPFHADLAAAKLAGIPLNIPPMLKRMEARKIASVSEINYLGDAVSRFGTYAYKIPDTSGGLTNLISTGLPKLVRRFLAKHVQTRPVFNHDKCTGCGICKENCPPQVISINNKKASAGYAACIRCYCCQELCPQKAVKIFRPALSRMLRL